MIRQLTDMLFVGIGFIGVFLVFGLVLKAFEPFWPATTLLTALGMTLVTWEGDGRAKFMCVGGLALYATGWIISTSLGPIIGSAVCATGFLIWFQAFLRSFFLPFMARAH